jgi:hypothetical protein
MLGICGTTAISRDQQFMTAAKCPGNPFGNRVDRRAQLWIVARARKRFARAAKVLGHRIGGAPFVWAMIGHGPSNVAQHLPRFHCDMKGHWYGAQSKKA